MGVETEGVVTDLQISQWVTELHPDEIIEIVKVYKAKYEDELTPQILDMLTTLLHKALEKENHTGMLLCLADLNANHMNQVEAALWILRQIGNSNDQETRHLVPLLNGLCDFIPSVKEPLREGLCEEAIACVEKIRRVCKEEDDLAHIISSALSIVEILMLPPMSDDIETPDKVEQLINEAVDIVSSKEGISSSLTMDVITMQARFSFAMGDYEMSKQALKRGLLLYKEDLDKQLLKSLTRADLDSLVKAGFEFFDPEGGVDIMEFHDVVLQMRKYDENAVDSYYHETVIYLLSGGKENAKKCLKKLKSQAKTYASLKGDASWDDVIEGLSMEIKEM